MLFTFPVNVNRILKNFQKFQVLLFFSCSFFILIVETLTYFANSVFSFKFSFFSMIFFQLQMLSFYTKFCGFHKINLQLDNSKKIQNFQSFLYIFLYFINMKCFRCFTLTTSSLFSFSRKICKSYISIWFKTVLQVVNLHKVNCCESLLACIRTTLLYIL